MLVVNRSAIAVIGIRAEARISAVHALGVDQEVTTVIDCFIIYYTPITVKWARVAWIEKPWQKLRSAY